MVLSEYAIKWGVTGAIWIGWCVIHSLLNSEGPIRATGLLDSKIGRYFRLLYSITAVFTLLLANYITPNSPEFEVWRFQGLAFIIKVLIWAIAIIMFYLTFKFFNLWHFLGLSAIGLSRRNRDSQKKLITWGIYGVVRHPQFCAGLVILWVRNLTDTDLIINIVLSIYLIIGGRIEEKRLLRIYGNAYSDYMKMVPGFIPNHVPSLNELFCANPENAESPSV